MRVLLGFKTKVAIADAANRWGGYACCVTEPGRRFSFSFGYVLLLWGVLCIFGGFSVFFGRYAKGYVVAIRQSILN